MSSLTHISLFSGIGGDSLAAQWAGFETILFVENDSYCQKVLNKNFSGVPIIGDIKDATRETIMADATQQSRQAHQIRTGRAPAPICTGESRCGGGAIPPVTLITGGFPCQPVSHAGKRGGKEDDRWLWPEMLRVISEVRPTWCVAENVLGLLTMGFYDCLSDLESQGYETIPFVIPACGVNAPHRRNRIFIVAHTINGEYRGGRGQSGETDSIQGINRSALCPRGVSRTSQTDVADTDRGWQLQSQGSISKFRKRISNGSQDVADTWSPRSARRMARQEQGQEGNTRGSRDKGYQGGRRQGIDHWAVEPDVGRVAHGVPSRVDRLKGLGNAIVPQQIYPILQAIADIENNKVL